MNKLFDQFTQFFDQQGWTYHQRGEKPVLHLGFNGNCGRWACVAIVHDDEETIGFLSFFPSRAPLARRAAVAELLMRINYHLVHGSFQMDFEDGEILFQTSLPTPNKEVTAEQVERLVFINLSTTDHHYDAIMRVIHGGTGPKVALKAKEKQKPKPGKVRPRFELN